MCVMELSASAENALQSEVMPPAGGTLALHTIGLNHAMQIRPGKIWPRSHPGPFASVPMPDRALLNQPRFGCRWDGRPSGSQIIGSPSGPTPENIRRGLSVTLPFETNNSSRRKNPQKRRAMKGSPNRRLSQPELITASVNDPCTLTSAMLVALHEKLPTEIMGLKIFYVRLDSNRTIASNPR